MKKALAFVAIALVAVATQAASVSWKSGTMYNVINDNGDVGSDKAKQTVTGVYLIVDADTYNTYIAGGQSLYDAYTGGKITATRTSGSLTSNNGGQANWTDSTDITKATSPVYALAIFTQEFNGNTFFIASSATAEVNDMGDVTGDGYQSMGAGSWTKVAPVPEPCSVALLALGLAAFGMKRKIA